MNIFGNLIDDETRCEHYNSTKDIIAVKMKCCGKYYACIKCHNKAEVHKPQVWNENEFETLAIICGQCKTEISINKYLQCQNICPNCGSEFNEKCRNHYHLYFEYK